MARWRMKTILSEWSAQSGLGKVRNVENAALLSDSQVEEVNRSGRDLLNLHFEEASAVSVQREELSEFWPRVRNDQHIIAISSKQLDAEITRSRQQILLRKT